MRFLKGDIKNSKKKSGRICVFAISKHSDKIPGNKRPGDVIIHDELYYFISEYIEGEPRQYDTEEIRVQTFKICLKNLKTLLGSSDVKEIAIPYKFGSYNIEQWKMRKKMLKEFEELGYEILVYVPIDDQI